MQLLRLKLVLYSTGGRGTPRWLLLIQASSTIDGYAHYPELSVNEVASAFFIVSPFFTTVYCAINYSNLLVTTMYSADSPMFLMQTSSAIDTYCPSLTVDPDAGEYLELSREIGGEALLECHRGYHMSNAANNPTHCIEGNATHGYWSPVPPTCEGTQQFQVCLQFTRLVLSTDQALCLGVSLQYLFRNKVHWHCPTSIAVKY